MPTHHLRSPGLHLGPGMTAGRCLLWEDPIHSWAADWEPSKDSKVPHAASFKLERACVDVSTSPWGFWVSSDLWVAEGWVGVVSSLLTCVCVSVSVSMCLRMKVAVEARKRHQILQSCSDRGQWAMWCEWQEWKRVPWESSKWVCVSHRGHVLGTCYTVIVILKGDGTFKGWSLQGAILGRDGDKLPWKSELLG